MSEQYHSPLSDDELRATQAERADQQAQEAAQAEYEAALAFDRELFETAAAEVLANNRRQASKNAYLVSQVVDDEGYPNYQVMISDGNQGQRALGRKQYRSIMDRYNAKRAELEAQYDDASQEPSAEPEAFEEPRIDADTEPDQPDAPDDEPDTPLSSPLEPTATEDTADTEPKVTADPADAEPDTDPDTVPGTDIDPDTEPVAEPDKTAEAKPAPKPLSELVPADVALEDVDPLKVLASDSQYDMVQKHIKQQLKRNAGFDNATARELSHIAAEMTVQVYNYNPLKPNASLFEYMKSEMSRAREILLARGANDHVLKVYSTALAAARGEEFAPVYDQMIKDAKDYFGAKTSGDITRHTEVLSEAEALRRRQDAVAVVNEMMADYEPGFTIMPVGEHDYSSVVAVNNKATIESFDIDNQTFTYLIKDTNGVVRKETAHFDEYNKVMRDVDKNGEPYIDKVDKAELLMQLSPGELLQYAAMDNGRILPDLTDEQGNVIPGTYARYSELNRLYMEAQQIERSTPEGIDDYTYAMNELINSIGDPMVRYLLSQQINLYDLQGYDRPATPVKPAMPLIDPDNPDAGRYAMPTKTTAGQLTDAQRIAMATAGRSKPLDGDITAPIEVPRAAYKHRLTLTQRLIRHFGREGTPEDMAKIAVYDDSRRANEANKEAVRDMERQAKDYRKAKKYAKKAGAAIEPFDPSAKQRLEQKVGDLPNPGDYRTRRERVAAENARRALAGESASAIGRMVISGDMSEPIDLNQQSRDAREAERRNRRSRRNGQDGQDQSGDQTTADNQEPQRRRRWGRVMGVVALSAGAGGALVSLYSVQRYGQGDTGFLAQEIGRRANNIGPALQNGWMRLSNLAATVPIEKLEEAREATAKLT